MKNIVSRCLDVVMFILKVLMLILIVAESILGLLLMASAMAVGLWPIAAFIAAFVGVQWYLVLDANKEGK